MAHELANLENGEAAMAYTGKTPWHDLGQALDPDASITEWADASGLSIELGTTPVQNGQISVPGRNIVYRKDTNVGLSIVSDRYHVVQPIEILEAFAKYVEGAAKIETAGMLFGGRQYWALARLDGEINVAGDITHPYMMLSSSCDGTTPTRARFTTVRVVCNNTLRMADVGAPDYEVRHTSVFDQEKLHEQMESVHLGLAAYDKTLKALASIKADEEFARQALAKLIRTTPDKLGRAGMRILELFQGGALGSEFESANDTAYGLLQAYTQYTDWEAGSKQDNRLNSAWNGRLSVMKGDFAKMLLQAA